MRAFFAAVLAMAAIAVVASVVLDGIDMSTAKTSANPSSVRLD